MLNKVYLVRGNTGEYDMYQTWDVACYTEPEMATLHCRRANEWLKERKLHRDDKGVGVSKWEGWDDNDTGLDLDFEDRERNPYDKAMRIVYTGTSYTVEQIPLYAHLDQYLEQT